MQRETLLRIRTLAEVTDLLVQLGYQPADHPYSDGVRVVARWKGFKVVGAESADPRETTRRLARKLARDGERAFCVALGNRELAVAAPRLGAPSSTLVLVVSLDHPTAIAIEQLECLRPRPGSTALAHTLRVVDALSTEVAGDRFFTEFRVTLERLAASIDKRRTLDDRRLAALLALTRVLFLYFIQAKGWLAGRPDYLRVMLDLSLGKGRHFHRTALDPLFFGVLNRPRGERSTRCAIDGIPYLNGGLFEPHPVECRIGPVHFSNDLWRDAFERLFDRFRFCVREAHEVDAIAPDMLGRVFERLMNPDERARSGTFYTPESVVREIVRGTLVTALAGAGQLTIDTTERLFTGAELEPEQRREARAGLRRLRVLDPAVGSGAFLLSALELLADATSLVEETGELNRWHARRRILRENLFGVDLNPVAVRLAELRLWLAVVADDPTTEISQINPLPNLDGVVRQGNTLIDPISTARTYSLHFDLATSRVVEQVRVARGRVFETRGAAAAQALESLRVAEQQLAYVILEQASRSTGHTLREFDTVAETQDLFGRKPGLTPAQRSQKRAIEQNRCALERALTALRDGTVPFFSFEVHTPDILASGGFHAVIGNPPWVRAERLSPDERRVLRQRFSWWRASAQRGFAHLPDLALAFLQRALELTAPGGAVGLLLPSKVASADYGHTARRHLVRETTISYLHRVSDQEAAKFGATTYPLALILRKEPPPPDHAVRLGLGETDLVRQTKLSDSGPWVLVPDRSRDALEQFRTSGPAVREIATPALGVKTGADAILVGTIVTESGPVTLVRFGETEIDIEPSVLRRAVRGRDVLPFEIKPSRVIIWAYDRHGKLLQRLPTMAAQHIDNHRQRLLARSDYRRGPPWVLFRTRPALASNRVVWRDIARRPCAVMLDGTDAGDVIPLNSCYVASFPSAQCALGATAVLNSTWCAALAAATADEARGGYRRINARIVGSMPTVASRQARARLAAMSAEAQRNRNVSQSDLDEAVATALALPRPVQDRLRSLAANHR